MVARSIASVLTDFTPKHVPADRVTVFAAGTGKERADPLEDRQSRSKMLLTLIDYELKVKEAFAAGRQSGQAEAVGSVRGREDPA